MSITLILATSILAQFLAATIAIYLVKVTGRWLGWSLVAIAILLMGVRRSVTLFLMIGGEKPIPAEPTAELIALAISVLMVIGLWLIIPIFSSIRKSESDLKEKNTWQEERLRFIQHGV